MSKITFGSTFGNYDWQAETDVSNEQARLLAPLGALQIAQRSPSTSAEKELAGYDKRPNGFKRTSIPFSEAGAETLRKHLSSLTLEVGEGKDKQEIVIPVSVTSVVEHVESTKDSLYVAERAKYVQRKDSLAALAKAVGYDGEVGDGTAENAPMPFLQAIRAWVRAQADKL